MECAGIIDENQEKQALLNPGHKIVDGMDINNTDDGTAPQSQDGTKISSKTQQIDVSVFFSCS